MNIYYPAENVILRIIILSVKGLLKHHYTYFGSAATLKNSSQIIFLRIIYILYYQFNIFISKILYTQMQV